jgi:uncharacterized protein (DUF952 family)
MRVIYHLVPRPVWELAPAGPYIDPSLAAEGFIHCSTAAQVARVANLFFADQPELLVLYLDAARLGDTLRDEPAAAVGDNNPFAGETFPHVYGPLDRAAILAVQPLTRGPDGGWTFPAGV